MAPGYGRVSQVERGSVPGTAQRPAATARVPGGNGSGPGWNGGIRGPGGHGPGTRRRRNVTRTDGPPVLGGNQVIAPITAPINVCGNAVGNGQAGCLGGASVENGGAVAAAAAARTSGRPACCGGNQMVAPITAPINVCGNAVAVLGNAFAGCKGGASVGRRWRWRGRWQPYERRPLDRRRQPGHRADHRADQRLWQRRGRPGRRRRGLPRRLPRRRPSGRPGAG